MNTHIANCPFCSGIHLHTLHHLFSYNVECCTCKAAGPREKSEQMAVEVWNNLSHQLAMAKEIQRNNLIVRMAEIENAVQQLEVELHS